MSKSRRYSFVDRIIEFVVALSSPASSIEEYFSFLYKQRIIINSIIFVCGLSILLASRIFVGQLFFAFDDLSDSWGWVMQGSTSLWPLIGSILLIFLYAGTFLLGLWGTIHPWLWRYRNSSYKNLFEYKLITQNSESVKEIIYSKEGRVRMYTGQGNSHMSYVAPAITVKAGFLKSFSYHTRNKKEFKVVEDFIFKYVDKKNVKIKGLEKSLYK